MTEELERLEEMLGRAESELAGPQLVLCRQVVAAVLGAHRSALSGVFTELKRADATVSARVAATPEARWLKQLHGLEDA